MRTYSKAAPTIIHLCVCVCEQIQCCIARVPGCWQKVALSPSNLTRNSFPHCILSESRLATVYGKQPVRFAVVSKISNRIQKVCTMTGRSCGEKVGIYFIIHNLLSVRWNSPLRGQTWFVNWRSKVAKLGYVLLSSLPGLLRHYLVPAIPKMHDVF